MFKKHALQYFNWVERILMDIVCLCNLTYFANRFDNILSSNDAWGS